MLLKNALTVRCARRKRLKFRVSGRMRLIPRQRTPVVALSILIVLTVRRRSSRRIPKKLMMRWWRGRLLVLRKNVTVFRLPLMTFPVLPSVVPKIIPVRLSLIVTSCHIWRRPVVRASLPRRRPVFQKRIILLSMGPWFIGNTKKLGYCLIFVRLLMMRNPYGRVSLQSGRMILRTFRNLLKMRRVIRPTRTLTLPFLVVTRRFLAEE